MSQSFFQGLMEVSHQNRKQIFLCVCVPQSRTGLEQPKSEEMTAAFYFWWTISLNSGNASQIRKGCQIMAS